MRRIIMTMVTMLIMPMAMVTKLVMLMMPMILMSALGHKRHSVAASKKVCNLL